jgi:hypothetical protein
VPCDAHVVDAPRMTTSPEVSSSQLQGLMLLPLLAAALLAPGAARATFAQANKPVPAGVAVSRRIVRHVRLPVSAARGLCIQATTRGSHVCLETLLQAFMDTGNSKRASDWQYPSWQRNQWTTWSELQLSGEEKRRLAAAVLACGILVVLAFKLIATNAAHSVLDKPSDKCVLGLLGHMCTSTLLQQVARPYTQAPIKHHQAKAATLSDTTLADVQEGGRLEGRR